MNTATVTTGTWTKFDGTWMVRVTTPVAAATAGDLGTDVEVSKKDGSVKVERIARVAEFVGDGFTIHSLVRDLGRKALAHQRAEDRGDLLDQTGETALELDADAKARVAARLAR